MVPYGTKLQLWDGDGNSSAGAAIGNYAELHGEKLLNTQGLLECKNVSEFSNLNLQYETTAYHKYTRTQWGTIDNEPDYGTPKGTWKNILSGQVISHTVTFGWEAGMSTSVQLSSTATL